MQEVAFVALVLALALGAYWSFVLLPRQRSYQKRQRMARELQEGDEIITFGGIIGRVMAIDAAAGIATVEIAPGTRIRLVTAAMMRPYIPEELASDAQYVEEVRESAS